MTMEEKQKHLLETKEVKRGKKICKSNKSKFTRYKDLQTLKLSPVQQKAFMQIVTEATSVNAEKYKLSE